MFQADSEEKKHSVFCRTVSRRLGTDSQASNVLVVELIPVRSRVVWVGKAGSKQQGEVGLEIV